jgi:iron complex outermembrane recepter protein
MNVSRPTLLSVALLAGIAAMPAAAADQANTATLEEVVVTAQRRSEALETVPMSVTVVAPETLERAGVVNLETIGHVAAGVQLNYSGAFVQPAVRGITTLVNGNNVENNVAVYTDGIYSPSTISIASDMANVESVEVLKGPQGTLYGRNATGGAILINTRGPSKTFTSSVELGYAEYKDTSAKVFLAGPITDRLRYSLAANYRDTQGYFKLVSPTTIGAYDRNVGKQNTHGITGKLQYDFTDNLTATLAYKYIYNQDDRINFYSVYGHINTAILPAPPLRATVYGTVAFNDPAFINAARNEGDLKLVWKTGIGTLTSNTAYDIENQASAFDFDASYVQSTFTRIAFRQKTFQESLDYAINTFENLDLLVGALYYNDRISTPKDPDYGSPLGYTGTALTSKSRTDQITETKAVYVDGTWHLSDRWSLNAGGRFSKDSKSINSTTFSPAGAVLVGPITGDKDWSKFTGRLSARYELADKTDIYGTFSQGYRGGNFNTTVIPGIPFGPTKPETVNAFEVGFKTAQANYRFNTAAFYYDYKDINVNISVPAPSPPCAVPNTCGNVSVFSNAPGAKIYGLDAEVQWAPVNNLNLRAGAEYLHARYSSFPNAVGTGVNATNTLNVAGQVQDWTGQRLARAPDVTANLGIDYTVPTSIGKLMFSVNGNYTSKFAVNNVSLYGPLAPAELQNQQRFLQDAYTMVSGQVTLTSPSEHYYAQAFVRNLTDVVYRLNYNGSAFGDYSPRGEPRVYGMKVGMKF